MASKRESRNSRRGNFVRGPLVKLALAAGFFLLSACGESDLPPHSIRQPIALEKVPSLVRDAAKKALPGVELQESWENLDAQGKLHSYEIRGKKTSTGKTREVRVSPTGVILEEE
jgi:hypothetical protein